MNRNFFRRLLVVLAGGTVLYVASYGACRLFRPEIINTNDGPIAAFRVLYFPLRYVEAKRPDFYAKTTEKDSWLEVKVTQVDRSRSYVWCIWAGQEIRLASSELAGLEEGKTAWLHFTYELQTWDDFTSHLIPTVDSYRRNARR